jgi:hypothetical protein
VEDEEAYVEGLDLGMGMMEHYLRFAKVNDNFRVLAVEKQMLIDVPGHDAVYTLQPDAVIEDEHNRVWIMEHKTAAQLPTQTDYLLMDEQCGSYLWGLFESTGIRAEGVLYNIARKAVPTPMRTNQNGLLSLDKRVSTTYDYAKAQITVHHANKHQPVPWNHYRGFLDYLRGKGEKFFFRENVRRNMREIGILAEMISLEVGDMLNPELPIYRNPSKFNCGNCSFMGPCLALYEGSDFEDILEHNYIDRA